MSQLNILTIGLLNGKTNRNRKWKNYIQLV